MLMNPALGMDAFRIGAEIKKRRPGGVVHIRRLGRPGNMRLAAAAKFDLRAPAAIGAIDQEHGRSAADTRSALK